MIDTVSDSAKLGFKLSFILLFLLLPIYSRTNKSVNDRSNKPNKRAEELGMKDSSGCWSKRLIGMFYFMNPKPLNYCNF